MSEAVMRRGPVRVVMGALLVAMFLASVDQTIVATGLPTIVGEFQRADRYAWVITTYLLAETAFTPIFGKAGDLYGRKRVLQVAIVVFLAGSVLCALADSMWQLVAFRAVQGAGAGGILAATLGVVADLFPPRERGRYQGAYVSVFALAAILGPPLGGFFVDGPGWRWAFWATALIGVGVLSLIGPLLRLPVRSRPAVIDWWGALLLVAGVATLILVLTLGGRELRWASAGTLGLAALSVALLTGFVLRQRTFVEPVLPPKLFGDQVVAMSFALAFVIGAIMLGALAFLPQFLQLAQGLSATNAGLALVPVLGSALVTSTVVGRLIRRVGRYRRFAIGGMAALSLGVLLLSTVDAHTAYGLLVVPLVLLGAGVGMSTPALFIATANAAAGEHVGVASSAVSFFRALGGAVGAAGFGAILVARLNVRLAEQLPGWSGDVNEIIEVPRHVAALPAAVRDGVRDAYAASLRDALLVAAPVAVGGWLASWWLRDAELSAEPAGTARDTEPTEATESSVTQGATRND
ncbi:MDR family MFS transporter [Verrucosispora sioxanthis]|uniref:MFS transporter n=1 Tax=Verrucosispora sioxanthis TaxID=2499994 RepID=A0A6M1L0A6_9ACTN|nr:MDR family MFS transporter [Verrucosispora sioxanthis]NEE64442.1 MFS transporter [Verrucosispora sioxanthis]NGM13552.1 MFS transporter [Verrucosispora sioxanthis]